jgi:hypothetical protein
MQDHSLALSSKALSEVPVRIGKDDNWAKLATGSGFLVGLRQDGSLWSAGANIEGHAWRGRGKQQDQLRSDQ